MKILIINTIPFDFNGMSVMIMNYFKHFDHQQIHADFVVNGVIEKEFAKNITDAGGSFFIFRNRNRNPIAYLYQLHKLIKLHHYDLVYVHGNSATMSFELAACTGTKTIRLVHAHGQSTDHPILHKLLYAYFIRHYDHAFAASKLAGDWLYRGKPFTVIHNGIDPVDFQFSVSQRKMVRTKYNVDDSTRIILQVGSFTEQKNHEFALRMFAELLQRKASYRLWFLGAGPLKENLEMMAKTLGVENKTLFLNPTANTTDFYSAADLCIFPSKWEPFGIVALEAQASGLPVFVSDRFVSNVQVTDNVCFLNLNPRIWVKKILRTGNVNRSVKHDDEIRQHGYDINENAIQMQHLLREMCS